MKFKSYEKEVKKEIKRAELLAMELVGHMVESEAIEIARDKRVHHTGKLIQNMGHEVIEKDKVVRIGNPIKYSIYNEMGTYKMPARPFLKPAAYENFKAIKTLFEKAFKKEIK